jgi:hypothetical protein
MLCLNIDSDLHGYANLGEILTRLYTYELLGRLVCVLCTLTFLKFS